LALLYVLRLSGVIGSFIFIEIPGKKIKKNSRYFKIFLFDAIISNKRKYYEIPGIEGTV